MASQQVEVARSKAALLPSPAQTKGVHGNIEDVQRRRRNNASGLVGLANVGNSCYMNASLQALSNCPVFRQYFVDCCMPRSSDHRTSTALAELFRAQWGSQRPPSRLSARSVAETMKNRAFRGYLQQDAQEFLRCLLNQIHEELEFGVPPPAPSPSHSPSSQSLQSNSSEAQSSDSALETDPTQLPQDKLRKGVSEEVEASDDSSGSLTHLVGEQGKEVPVRHTPPVDMAAVYRVDPPTLVAVQVSPAPLASEEVEVQIVEGRPSQHMQQDGSRDRTVNPAGGTITPLTTCNPSPSNVSVGASHSPKSLTPTSGTPPTHLRGLQDSGHSSSRLSLLLPSLKVADKVGKRSSTPAPPPKPRSTSSSRSIVTDVFEGKMESSVKCSKCQQVSVKVDSFQDLSLPIPGRSEMAKAAKGDEREEALGTAPSTRRSICNFFTRARDWTRDLILGPPTSLDDCMSVFFDTCDLQNDNKYFCESCNSFQNGQKVTCILRLPELLCIHLKRFRFDTFHPSKIGRHISFPVDDLCMAPYLKEEGQMETEYELISMVTHIGDAHGGHYIAYAKNSNRNAWFKFDDSEVSEVTVDELTSKQAYLLFYKRAASLSQQQERAALLRQCSLRESPDLCLRGEGEDRALCCVSKHWMNLLRHASQPGPLFQYDYVCQHGAVLPTVNKRDYPVVAEHVPIGAWEKMVERHGGGPLVRDLQVCPTCQDLNSKFEARRRHEASAIKQLQLQRLPEVYVVAEGWVALWRKFLHGRSMSDLPPGPIDNRTLLVAKSDSLQLTRNGGAYHRVSEQVWDYLHQSYGGGPVIVMGTS